MTNKVLTRLKSHPVRTLAFLPVQIGAALVFLVVIGTAKAVKFFKELV